MSGGLLVGFIIGAVAAWILAVWLVKNKPETASRIWLSAGDSQATNPNLPPEVPRGPAALKQDDLPVSITNEEVLKPQKLDQIKDAELKTLVKKLPGWKPKRHEYEEAFHRSFLRFLLESDYEEEDVTWQPRINPKGQSPASGDKYAIPDFILKGRVLIEIKKSFDGTATADRAVGQLTRYVAYWRQKGPSLLLVCTDYDEQMRRVVDEQVRRWKALDIPVMAYYVRSPVPYDKTSIA